MGLKNYNDIDNQLKKKEMNDKNKIKYINIRIKQAKEESKKIPGYKSDVTKKYKLKKITETEKYIRNKKLNYDNIVLKEYIKNLEDIKHELKPIKGSGIKGRRRKQRGGNVMFFNDVKQLLKKLELIIGEVIAGNTSIQMRNTGVNILDTLLRMSTINRPQYNKLYNKYFKV